MNMQMSDLMMSLPHNFPLILFTEMTKITYCKRCYFRVTKFSRLAAQKHIRGLLNSR